MQDYLAGTPAVMYSGSPAKNGSPNLTKYHE